MSLSKLTNHIVYLENSNNDLVAETIPAYSRYEAAKKASDMYSSYLVIDISYETDDDINYNEFTHDYNHEGGINEECSNGCF